MNERILDAIEATLRARLPDVLRRVARDAGARDRADGRPMMDLPVPARYVHGPIARLTEGEYPAIGIVPDGWTNDGQTTSSPTALRGRITSAKLDVRVVAEEGETTTRKVERYADAVEKALGEDPRLGGEAKGSNVTGGTFEMLEDGRSTLQRTVMSVSVLTVASGLRELRD